MGDAEGIWELYGLRTNPFLTAPLLVRGGLLPIDCFVGREKELNRLTKLFGTSGGSRILVCGDVGVGKTSLVNYARNKAIQKGQFTPFKEIAVQGNWTPSDFVLNTLYAIHSTIKLQKNRVLDAPLAEKLRGLVELPDTTTAVSGISVAGIGMTVERAARGAHTYSAMALMDFFQEVLANIRKKTGRDVILHYNNLENLSETALRSIFDDLRDALQTENTHFVFVGNYDVHSTFQSMPRIASIMTDTPIILEQFTIGEIERVLEIRMRQLRISDKINYITPYRKEALAKLYEIYGGNIRNILNSISTAVIEATGEKPVNLDEATLARTLAGIVESRYIQSVPRREKDILLEAVKHLEVTNQHLSRQTGIARPNISHYTADLQKRGCMYLRRKDGKDKYWSVEPRIKWLLLKEDNKTKEKEKKHRKSASEKAR